MPAGGLEVFEPGIRFLDREHFEGLARVAFSHVQGRLGPGPDGPYNRTDTAGLEVPDRSLSERARSRLGNRSLERPAEPWYHSHDLACHRSEAQAGTQDAEQLDGAFTVDVGPVGSGDSENHADLV